jgi:predicted  nucleic acid-binding Zn-ribbon protein
MEEDQAFRAAAEEARKRLGLQFERLRKDGVILRGLREALEDEVRQGNIHRQDGKVRLASIEELQKSMNTEREPLTP